MGQVPSDLIHRVQDEFFDARASNTTPPNQDGACSQKSVSTLRLVREGVRDLVSVIQRGGVLQMTYIIV